MKLTVEWALPTLLIDPKMKLTVERGDAPSYLDNSYSSLSQTEVQTAVSARVLRAA